MTEVNVFTKVPINLSKPPPPPKKERKTIPFSVASKIRKYLGISCSREV